MRIRLGTLLRIPIDGHARWRLYAGWGSDSGSMATADVTLQNWLQLRRTERGPYRIEPSPRGFRFHDHIRYTQ